MEGLVRAVAHASGWWILALALVVIVQGVLIARLSSRLGTHNRRWRAIARDASGLDLETILADHARERAELTALYEGGQGRLAIRLAGEQVELTVDEPVVRPLTPRVPLLPRPQQPVGREPEPLPS